MATHITSWFPDAKLGIFVHWGVFKTMYREEGDPIDMPAGQRSIPREEYVRRAGLLTCENFDMDQWASMFKRWGARYAVLTARHAMGFPLWDTRVEPERSIVNMSPYGKDIVAQWCDGLRKAGLRVGIYFSHRDWGDPDFCARMENEGFRESDPVLRDRKWNSFIEKRNAKVTELTTRYGRIDQFWADENWGATPEQLHSEEMVDIILTNQPRIVMNSRFGLPYAGMYGNPEQNVPVIVARRGERPFEVCDTLVDSPHWQFVAQEGRAYKDKKDVLRFFIDTITHGGNYLINIGPDWTGRIPEREIAMLDYLGEFCHKNQEAIYGTWAGIDRVYFGGGSTQRDGAIYLFSVDQARTELAFRGLRNKIVRVSRLDTGEERPFRLSGGRPSHHAPAYVWIDTRGDAGSEIPVVYKVEYEGKQDLCPW